MKKLIMIFVLIANVFAGEWQETFCNGKSLPYCINHFDRQCKAKNYVACSIVGGLHTEQEQYSQAKQYFEMVCERANIKDAFEVKYIDGIVVKVPIIKPTQASCEKLGIFYYNGLGVRQSYKKSLQYYKKACDLGSGDSCFSVGEIYHKGKGVEKDLNYAMKLVIKSCELKSSFGCAALGAMYEYGEGGVNQNLSRAKELYGKACDLGFQYDCDKYKKVKEKGY